MDPKNLQKGEELLKRSTPGPWRWWTSNSYRRLSSDLLGKDGDVLRATVQPDGWPDVVCSETDRELIVWLRNNAEELIEAAKKALDGSR